MSVNSDLYDSITDAWQYLLGENFHWGLFLDSSEDLPKATQNLIDLMLNQVQIDSETKLLDIGCGIGTPALDIHSKYGCRVVGISNSKKGVSAANHNAKVAECSESVQFLLRDALDNKIASNSIDVCWLMEMSHLIDDKEKLLLESYRTLKKGGQIVLCDLMFRRPFGPLEASSHLEELKKLELSFGKARIETIDFYNILFNKIGLKDIEVTDISDQVKDTLKFWKRNALDNYKALEEDISKAKVDNFIDSCEILKEFYDQKIWGYGIIVGKK